jgi:glycosyltransferase involved in cell wall biosynthesis
MKPIIAHMLPFPGIGGTEIATLRLAQAAQISGYENIMFCPSPAVQELFASNGFRTFPYEQAQPSYRHPSSYWRNSMALARRVRQERASLIHCADVLAAHYISLAALLAHKKLVCHVRNRAASISARDRSFLAPVRKFIFVSNHTRQTFALNVPEPRGIVLYDGVDPRPDPGVDVRRELAARIRREFNIPSGRKLIGMVARLAPQKDFATLARAAAQIVRKRDVCFMLVGDYSAPLHRQVYDETQSLLASLGIADRFVFTGFRRDVPELVAALDVFVLSTHQEGFPLVILEAMADGRPVAATAIDGVPEIVSHEQTGLLHNLKDHDQLAANLMRLLDDPPFAARLAAAGRDLVSSRFGRARYEENVGALYRSLIPGGQG